MLLRNRMPFPTPGGLSLCQGLGGSHRSPCRRKQADRQAAWTDLFLSGWGPAPCLPTLPDSFGASLRRVCLPAVDSSWVKLCTDISQQEPFPGPQAALCGPHTGAMPDLGSFQDPEHWPSWVCSGGRGLLTAPRLVAWPTARWPSPIHPGQESKPWPLPACQGDAETLGLKVLGPPTQPSAK